MFVVEANHSHARRHGAMKLESTHAIMTENIIEVRSLTKTYAGGTEAVIYEIIVDHAAAVGVRMTLTAPACPAAQWLPAQVEEKVKAVEGVTDARVDVVFDPPWSKDNMSEAAKLQLGLW